MTVAPAASPAASGSGSQLIEAALRAAAGATGMQLVFVSAIHATTLTWRQVYGSYPGVLAGHSQPLEDSFCARMIAGAPPSTANAEGDPAYADAPMRRALGVVSFVGVPLRQDGVVTGTLGGIDAAPKPLQPAVIRLLAALGRVVTADAARDPEVTLHRTATGWDVEQGGLALPAEDITVAMTLADLIAGDTGMTVPPQRPERPGEDITELERLRVQIGQLEHALSARVVIEQAIGVLAQRFGLPPREAFDRLRKAARSRGQRVHDLAVNVVRSARDQSITLPRDLR